MLQKSGTPLSSPPHSGIKKRCFFLLRLNFHTHNVVFLGLEHQFSWGFGVRLFGGLPLPPKKHSLKEALGLLRWFEDLNFEVDVISLLVPRIPKISMGTKDPRA